MRLANLGDMAQSTMLRRDTVAVKNDLNRLTQEMSSGRAADLQTTLAGRFGPLAGLERSLAMTDAHERANAAAARIFEGQQTALGTVQDILLDAGPEYLKIASTGEATQLSVTFAQAGRQLEQVVAALNTRVAGEALFAGAALQGPALAPAETILASLETALAGAVTPADVVAAATAWFDTPGGGFETDAYAGSTTERGAMDIAPDQRETPGLSALDPAIRDTIRGLALAALMEDGLLAGDAVSQREVLRRSGETLIAATDALTAKRAGIGFAQERIETAGVQTAASRTGLSLARAALVEVDPYETAMRLQQVQTQLETIYTITARVSGLSLASVLR